jgi:tetratricopeptide (TPR) repeat protein
MGFLSAIKRQFVQPPVEKPEGNQKRVNQFTHSVYVLIAAQSFTNLAMEAIDDEDYVMAIAHFTQALHLEPNNAQNHLMRGLLFAAQKDLMQFEIDRRKAGELDETLLHLTFDLLSLDSIIRSYRDLFRRNDD